MHIVGTANILGTEFFFARRETKSSLSWYIFNKEVEIEDRKYRISLESLKSLKFADLKPFIVSAHKITTEELLVYGNPNLVNKVISANASANNFNYEKEDSKRMQDSLGLVLEHNRSKDLNYLRTKHLYRNFELNPMDINSSLLEKDNTIDLNKTNTFTKLKTIVKNTIVSKRLEKNEKAKKSVEFKGDLIHLDFRYSDVELKTINYSISSPRDIKLDWQTVDLELNRNKNQMESIMASSAKSIPQLRINHDLSWFFDERGRMKKNYKIVNTLEDLEWYCKEIFPKLTLWAVDIESTGLNMFIGKNKENFDHTVSIMMSWEKDQAIFIPIDMVYIDNIPEGWVEILKPWLEKIGAVGHNLIFDAKGLLADFGINLNIKHDTQILNFNVNTYRAKMLGNSLKKLEHRILNIDTLELKDIFGTSKKAGLFRYLKPTTALLYACPDVDMCLQLLKILWKELPVSCRKSYKLDMETCKHLYKLDSVGNRVDMERALEFRRANNEDRNILEELIYKLVGQTIAKKEKIESLVRYIEKNKEVDDSYIDKELKSFFESDNFKNARKKFDLNSTKQLGKIMFDLMGYPIIEISEKSKLPKIDAGVLKKLMDYKIPKEQQTKWLKSDIKSAFKQFSKKAEPLVREKEFNSLQYPLALLMVEYRLRDKRDGTFFHQIIDGSVEERYYTSSKPANAETFRIINVVQTLQGFMKQLILPYSKDHYMVVFDFSQIEYRYMAGMAHVTELVKTLNSARADFHKECCALLHNIKPYQVTSSMRKEGKSLNFAIPYGMAVISICIQLFKEVTQLNLVKAQRQLNRWQEKFHLIWENLEEMRSFALNNGYAYNARGRRRYFYTDSYIDEEKNLESLNKWKEGLSKGRKGAIRRASGNFPIQSGAADLFKIALCNFRRRLKEEGLDDLVLTTATIHDELVNSVHKSVNKYYLYKIIYEECMLKVKGHPRYFAGISVVDNWEEGKDDLYEAPIEFVESIINSEKSKEKFVYQEDAKNSCMADIREFMRDLFIKEYKSLGVDLESSKINIKEILEKCQDYFILDKISVYYPVPKEHGSVNKKYDNDKFIRSFEEFILKEGKHSSYHIIYPEDYPDGKEAILSEKGRDFSITNTGAFKVFLSKEEVNEIIKKKEEKKEEIKFELNLTEDSEESLKYESLNLDLEDEPEKEEELNLDIFDDNRLNILYMYEQEENEKLFEDEDVFVSLAYKTNFMQDKREEEGNPEDEIKVYSTENDTVRISSNYLFLNLANIYFDNRKDAIDYLNNYCVNKDTLGSVEVVTKMGSEYNYTGVYIKDYNLAEMKKYFLELEKELVKE